VRRSANASVAANASAMTEESHRSDRDPEREIRVLIVEDMEFEAEFASRRLRTEGIAHIMHRVETEAELRAALAHFQPEIILSDFSLPQFDGLSALEIAREVAPDIPFLFVSGTIGEERAIEALHRGAVDYVLKTNLARLVPAVRRALAEAEARQVRRRQEAQIARLTGVLRMLSGINSAVVRIRDRNELLREACRLAVSVGGYASALVGLRQPKTHVLKAVAWSGDEEDSAAKLCARVAEHIRAARAGSPASHVETQFVVEDAEPAASAQRYVTSLPLVVDRTPIGTLVICPRDPGRLADEELRMLREVAANLAFALQYLQQNTRVRWLSYFDVLTGLAKRSLFCERLGELLRGPGELTAGCAVAVIDIENLSAVNDSFGRHTGDLLLQLLADRLKRSFQDTQRLAHFSGGTFAVVQPVNRATRGALEALSAHLGGLFAEPFRLDGKDVPVAGRSGIALFPEDGDRPETLVQKAEATLRTAKLAHERLRHYSAEVHSASLARVAVERKLRAALERQQFELHYQPKVGVKTRRIAGVEALIRWNDPDQGLVSPGEFLPILEESGLIVEVGDWVIERAAADCLHWAQLGLPPVRVAVNISPAQLRAGNFVARFLEHTRAWATPSCGIDAEITEGALLDESAEEVTKLKILRASGVNIAIDDFGTGYSSLSRLAHLPVDTLKIDRSFIREMSSDPRARKLVSSIISIARAFRMLVVAEGVETQDQLDGLWQLGCDQSQGYLHSRPVSRDVLTDLLAHGKGRFLLPDAPGADDQESVPNAAG